MNAVYRELAERLKGEIPDLDRLVQRVLKAWPQAQSHEVYLDSVALNFHGFYSGLERLFELIARHIDRDLPTGTNWHRDLVQQMVRDLPTIRPAVIGEDHLTALDEFRRFRHLVRNIYTIDLQSEKVEKLIPLLVSSWSGIQAELLAFAQFLEELADATESES